MHRMHTLPKVREWMHVAHDKGAKAIHSTEHVFHEKTFWVVFAALAVATLLLMLAVMLGDQVVVEGYTIPPPHGP